MKKSCTKEVVIQIMNTILESENTTLLLYEDYLNQLVDGKVVEVFKQLWDEEVLHVESIKSLIERLNVGIR